MVQDFAAKFSLHCFLTGMAGGVVIVQYRWPVEWGRGCTLIKSSGEPLAEGEEGRLEDETP